MRLQTRYRRAQRKAAPVGKYERLEEDVDKTVGVGEVGRRRIDDSNLCGRGGLRDDVTADDERILEVHANQLSGLRRL